MSKLNVREFIDENWMKILFGVGIIGVGVYVIKNSGVQPPKLIRRKSLLDMATEFVDKAHSIGISDTGGFTAEQVQDMYDCFQSFGSTGGQISKKQFAEIMGRIGFNDERAAFSLFDSWDVNNGGTLDFGEILHAFSLLSSGNFEQKLAMIFQAYDLNGNGAIDWDELVRAIRAQSEVRGDILTNEQVEVIVQKFFQHFDTNRDFKITFDEFKQGYLRFEESDFAWFSLGFDISLENKLADVFGAPQNRI